MKKFENKVVAITGGGSGLGKLSCEMFAAEGATVCVIDINAQTAGAVAESIVSAGGKAKAFAADITNESAMEKLFAEIHDTYGRLDVLFNNAGISPIGTVTTTSYADFRKVLAIDMESIFLGCKYAIPYMEKQGGGVILNTVGTFGLKPIPNKVGYACAKAGAMSLTRSVAIDFARSNIRCNAICPGNTQTNIGVGMRQPSERGMAKATTGYAGATRSGTPEEISAAAVFLASDQAGFINGETLTIDGGWSAY